MTSDKTEEAFDTLRVLHSHSELMLSLTLNADQYLRLTHESQDAGPAYERSPWLTDAEY